MTELKKLNRLSAIARTYGLETAISLYSTPMTLKIYYDKFGSSESFIVNYDTVGTLKDFKERCRKLKEKKDKLINYYNR